MPQYKLPKSLFKIALENVDTLVKQSCVNIEIRYGKYDSERCKEAAACLQQYLLSNIPGMVLDEVCEERRNRPYYRFRDVRINLAVYMHNNMKVFNIGDARLGIENGFWTTTISRLSKLVVLDLHLACTDEILEVVGQICPKLEQINIVSRLEPERVKVKREAFNALKLKFFISDVGLNHLSKCKLLKKITMNKMLRSQCGGRMMTDAGIRNLVKSLPYIEYVSYDDMGLVIAEGMDDIESLPLTYLSDHHPMPQHIAVASRICKRLQHLCLHLPHQTGKGSTVTGILNTLANSDLKVSNLELVQFPCADPMFSVFKMKGNHLTSLALKVIDPVTMALVRLIGQTCPNLKTLHLQEVMVGFDRYLIESPEHHNRRRGETLFSNLEYVCLLGNRWDPETILPLCLTHAKNLESLTLVSKTEYRFIDEILANILTNNPFSEVKSIHVFKGCLISLPTIHYFIKQCPKLVHLSFVQHSNISKEDIAHIQADIKKNNLDLRIEPTEMKRESI